jgi:hypothetical protein
MAIDAAQLPPATFWRQAVRLGLVAAFVVAAVHVADSVDISRKCRAGDFTDSGDFADSRDFSDMGQCKLVIRNVVTGYQIKLPSP